MINISGKQVVELFNANRAVAVYPRKGVIVVDGYKRYKANKTTIAKAQEIRELVHVVRLI